MNRCKRTALLNACHNAGQNVEPQKWTGSNARKLRRSNQAEPLHPSAKLIAEALARGERVTVGGGRSTGKSWLARSISAIYNKLTGKP